MKVHIGINAVNKILNEENFYNLVKVWYITFFTALAPCKGGVREADQTWSGKFPAAPLKGLVVILVTASRISPLLCKDIA